MIDKFLFTCNAVLPIILIIVLGYVIKRIKLLPENFYKAANKLCFRICLPVLLFYNIYNIDSIDHIANYWKVIVFAIIMIITIFIIGVIIAIFAVKDDKQKGVITSCIFRSNYAIIGIPLAASLATGNNSNIEGIASVISAVVVPIFNILAIISLSIFIKDDKKISIKAVALNIIKNPLIIGVVSGVVALAIRALLQTDNGLLFSIQRDLPFLYKTVENLARIASPLALIALGGDFTFKAISKLKTKIIMGTTIRVIGVPIFALVIAYLVGFRTEEFPALIALFATPVAVSSVPMAAEMGNDDELAGQLVVWTSILSAITLFLIIFVCTQIGIFSI